MSRWAGRVAVVLAVTVGGGWAAALVISALPATSTISEHGANLLATVGGVLAGGLTTYLGGAVTRGRTSEDPATRRGMHAAGSADEEPTPPD